MWLELFSVSGACAVCKLLQPSLKQWHIPASHSHGAGSWKALPWALPATLSWGYTWSKTNQMIILKLLIFSDSVLIHILCSGQWQLNHWAVTSPAGTGNFMMHKPVRHMKVSLESLTVPWPRYRTQLGTSGLLSPFQWGSLASLSRIWQQGWHSPVLWLFDARQEAPQSPQSSRSSCDSLWGCWGGLKSTREVSWGLLHAPPSLPVWQKAQA